MTWKDIQGYEGRYQVSDDGQVKSLPNSRRKTELIMRNCPHIKSGQLIVNLTYSHDGVWRQRKHYVHALVLLAFRGEPATGQEGCHNDGSPANNALGNLRWDTRAGNQADRDLHGTSNKGERNASAKLDETTVRSIKCRLTAGEKVGALAKEFGLWHGAISSIKNERTWGWI